MARPSPAVPSSPGGALTEAVAALAEQYGRSGNREQLLKGLRSLQTRSGSGCLKDFRGPSLTILITKAAACDHADVLEALLSLGMSPDACDEEGNTVLHVAALQGSASLAAVLLRRGVSLSRENRRGESPLHGAVLSGSEELVRLLIDGGADVNCKDNRGKTPLHLASAASSRELMLLLLARGADSREMDNEGNLPLERQEALFAPEAPFLLQQGSAAPLRSICYSPGGRFLAAAGDDGTIRLWSTMSGKLTGTLGGSGAPLTALAFSPGGHLASAGCDGTVMLWNWQADRVTSAAPAAPFGGKSLLLQQ